MAPKTRTREIILVDKSGKFNILGKKSKEKKSSYDFEALSALRKVLSNEKARVLHVVKTKRPGSIYELAKILERDVKAVNNDIKLLDRFGLIDLVSETKNNRKRLRPVIGVDNLNIQVRI